MLALKSEAQLTRLATDTGGSSRVSADVKRKPPRCIMKRCELTSFFLLPKDSVSERHQHPPNTYSLVFLIHTPSPTQHQTHK
jgi:hypothetical protein